MTERVLDLGAGDDPDARATETVDLYADADHQFDLTETWPIETDSVDGLVMNHVLEHMPDVEHVFAEAARVLRDRGWFEAVVPVGADAWADPDHEQCWTWRTPEVYCRETSAEEGRPWDPDPPFVLDQRDADVWLWGPYSGLTPLLQAMAAKWPAEAIRRCSSGELTARYRRVPR